MRRSNYDKFPCVMVGSSEQCLTGWERIAAALREAKSVCVECYPGADLTEIEEELRKHLAPDIVFCASDAYKSAEALQRMMASLLTEDRVFGHMNELAIDDYFDPESAAAMRSEIARAVAQGQRTLVVGTGAWLLLPAPAVLVYADMARWEIQLRYRAGRLGNLGLENGAADFASKYKCGFFVEWRAADRLKKQLLAEADFLLDTNHSGSPKMITGYDFRAALAKTSRRPFRVVPYFDPGPWGGHWMEEVCDLPRDVPNHAWCFDCVPEENSLLLGFGEHRVEIPAIDIVFQHPAELLGPQVSACFGAEFPIRFDFLDTMGGGNLSLQVHPLSEYIRARFGMHYTQDESYYLLDAGEDACVYLGLRDGISPDEMAAELYAAQNGGAPFDADKFVNRWPARKHEHFLIPAGTIHCSGANSMVLEISATPYIFTFKLWDWGRLGLDGRPRPIHLEHGLANIQWDRTTAWTRENLVDQVSEIARGPDWREERTGLHEREFIETRRHWFVGTVPHHTGGGVNVLNLVEGEACVVESPTDAFAPFEVHYAETFIVPAAVGDYTVRPREDCSGECATIKAYVRTSTG